MYVVWQVSLGMSAWYKYSCACDAYKTKTWRLLNTTFYDFLCSIYFAIYHRNTLFICGRSYKVDTMVYASA